MASTNALTTRFTLAAVGALTFALVLAVGGPAIAHTSLSDSTPDQGETVTDLDRIRLEFTDPLLDVGTVVSVEPAGGEAQDVQTEQVEDTVVEAEFPFSEPGEYLIRWRVVADDGHPAEGEIAFTFDPEVADPAMSPTPEPTPEPTEEPATQTPEPDQEASPTPEPTATPLEPVDPDVEGLDPLLAVGLALIAALVVSAVWMLTRKKDSTDPEDPDLG